MAVGHLLASCSQPWWEPQGQRLLEGLCRCRGAPVSLGDGGLPPKRWPLRLTCPGPWPDCASSPSPPPPREQPAVQSGQVKVPPGYHPLDVEKEWGKLHVAILEREKLLRSEFERS